MNRYDRLAYGNVKLPRKDGVDRLIDGGATIGLRIQQYVYLRPPKYGYRVGRK